MSYRPNRLTIGYERSHVLNPWVFADLRQPQRMRGFVSPLVYQTRPPAIYHPNLSGLGAEEATSQALVAQEAATVQALKEEQRTMQRAAFEMQKASFRLSKTMAIFGALSAVGGLIGTAIGVHKFLADKAEKKNR